MKNNKGGKPDIVYRFIAPVNVGHFNFVHIDLEPDDLHGRGMPIKKLDESEILILIMRCMLQDYTFNEISQACDVSLGEVEKIASGLRKKFNAKTYHGLVSAMYQMGMATGLVHG